MKKALVTANQLHSQIANVQKVFPSEDKVRDLINEIRNAIVEQQFGIAKLLKKLFESYDIPVQLKYWFTEDEIREGYVLLRKLNSMGATHVLFLKDMTDTFDGSKVKEGEIYPYNHVNHFLKRLSIEALNLKKSKKRCQKYVKVP